MHFEDAVVRRAEPSWKGIEGAGGNKAKLAKLARSRSASFVGGILTGTRLSKDWESARNLPGQRERLVFHRNRQPSSKDGAHYGGASPAGPFVRGPKRPESATQPQPGLDASWSSYEQRATSVFKKLDLNGTGLVSLDKLQESFEMMDVPIDEDTFSMYLTDYLKRDAGLDFQQFIELHKAVWKNQPSTVRSRWNTEAPRPGRPVPVEKSSPGLRHVQDAEGQLRRVYRKYAPLDGYLPVDDLPSVLADLGLSSRAVALNAAPSEARRLFRAADLEGDGALSFHEFVEFQNRYVASLENLRSEGVWQGC